MQEPRNAMTLVMTAVIALSVILDPKPAAGQAGAEPERSGLYLPRREPALLLPPVAPATGTFVQTQAEPPAQPPAAGQADVLASRGGQTFHSATPVDPNRSEDLYWLARIISAEAKGESLEGQIAVGAVIMNRVRDPRFPKTVRDVIFAEGQFDPVRFGTIHEPPVPTAVAAAERVLAGDNPVPGALYFYNPAVAADPWIRKLRVVARIGNHVFAAK